jgi:replicative DNA helicase
MTIPSNREAEAGVLSCAFQRPDWLLSKLMHVSPEAFHFTDLRTVFCAMVDLATEGLPIDPIAVKTRLGNEAKLDLVGGPAAVMELYTFVPIPKHYAYYLEIVEQAHILRRQMEAHTQALEVLQKCPVESIVATSAAMDQVKGILEEASYLPGQGLKRRTLSVVADEVLGQIEERTRSPGKLVGWTTGLASIDKRTGGLQKGHVWVFAGLPGDGKSTAMQNAAEAACQAGARVGWYPLEMPDTEQAFRIMASLSEVDNDALYTGQLSHGQQQSLALTMGRMKKLGVEMVDVDGASASDIIRDIEVAKYDVVVIDYLQLMEGEMRKGGNREEFISDTCRRIKRLANRAGCCILTASQLNDFGKLRESRAIGQHADKVCVINKCPNEREEGRISDLAGEHEFDDTRRIWWMDKNRGGRRNWEQVMRFLGHIFQFREIESK